MNKDLVMDAIVAFKGEWPEGATHIHYLDEGFVATILSAKGPQLVVNGRPVLSWLGGIWQISCTREQFEARLQELREAAPEGTTHYLTGNDKVHPCWLKDVEELTCKYKVILDEGAICPNGKIWETYNSSLVMNQSDTHLIPLPPEQPEIKDLPDVTDTNDGKWVPEAEELKTLYWVAIVDSHGTPWNHDGPHATYDNALKIIPLLELINKTDKFIVTEQRFKPLKTEAEKERDEGIKALTKILSKGVGDCEPDEYLATTVWDAGWRPSND